MSELDLLRSRLDDIDVKIAVLFQDRMDIIRDVAAYKRLHNLSVLQENREAIVINHALSTLRKSEDAQNIKDLYTEILRISKSCQQVHQEKLILPLVPAAQTDGIVGFPGTEGSFSEAAASAFFGSQTRLMAFETFDGVLRATADGDVRYAVLPIENSSAGAVSDTYDLLLVHNLYITGEQLLPIEHHLLGVPGSSIEDIGEVYSHPQALAQCRKFMSDHPKITAISSLNTAISARSVSEWGEHSKAAIAGIHAAQCFGLLPLLKNIHDNPFNTTRFVIVGRNRDPLRPANKATVAFRVPNKSGSLVTLLKCFADHGLNMSKIESRPIQGKPWEYAFIVDFDDVTSVSSMEKSLKDASLCSLDIRMLGIYGKAN